MDINELRNRLNNLNNKSKSTVGQWKPKDEHQVRLVQYPHDEDSFIERTFHYNIDQREFLCPKQFGNDCPVCEFAEGDLRNWNGPNGQPKPEAQRRADWELYKKIQSRPRFYVPMIERGKESEGVRFWSMTPAQMGQALDVCGDGDRLADVGVKPGDTAGAFKVLFDVEKGYDLTVSFKKPNNADGKGNTKSITLIEIKGKIRSSPLASSKKASDDLVKSCKNVKELLTEVSSAEVDKIFKKFLNGNAPEARAEGGVEKYGQKLERDAEASRPTNSKENAKLSGTRSVDEAFGEMLAEDEA